MSTSLPPAPAKAAPQSPVPKRTPEVADAAYIRRLKANTTGARNGPVGGIKKYGKE